MTRSRLRIIVFPETGGKTWTARALEHDIAAQGGSLEAAVDTLLKIARAHIAYDKRHNRTPLSAFGTAPRLYWSAFHAARQLTSPTFLAAADPSMPEVITAVVTQHPGAYQLLPIACSA
jgi:hypothetical protein